MATVEISETNQTVNVQSGVPDATSLQGNQLPSSPSAGELLRYNGTQWAHARPEFPAEAFGADPSVSGATNRQAVADAISAAKSAGGGIVTLRTTGTYDWDENGTSPYDSNKRYCIDLGDNETLNVHLHFGPGVHVQLASDQQTDANGAVDMIVGRDISGFALSGGGRGVSSLTGNTANQPNWTGGYAQKSNGNGLRLDVTSGNGCHDIEIHDIDVSDFFSNPWAIGEAAAESSNVHCRRTEHRDCGEGPHFKNVRNVSHHNWHVEDDAGNWVGDGWETSECFDVSIHDWQIVDVNAGTAVDLFGSHDVRASNFEINGCNSGFDLSDGFSGPIKGCKISDGRIIETQAPQGAFVTESGSDPRGVGVSNVDIVNPASLAFAFQHQTATEPIEFSNVSILAATSGGHARIKGAVELHWNGGSIVGDGTSISKAFFVEKTTGTPHLEIQGLSVKDVQRGVEYKGDGSSFSPTGFITGCTWRNIGNLERLFFPSNGSDFSATRIENNDHAVPDLSGSTPSVTGYDMVSLFNSAGTTVTDFVNQSKGQELIVQFNDGDSTISINGNPAISGNGGEDFAANSLAHLRLKYSEQNDEWLVSAIQN